MGQLGREAGLGFGISAARGRLQKVQRLFKKSYKNSFNLTWNSCIIGEDMGISPQAGRPNRKGERRMAANKILIVDDDKNICELRRLYMEKDGYTVALA